VEIEDFAEDPIDFQLRQVSAVGQSLSSIPYAYK